MAYDNFLIDKRVVERNITKGLVDPQQLKQQIESLPDRESNCVHVSLEGTASSPEEEQGQRSDEPQAAAAAPAPDYGASSADDDAPRADVGGGELAGDDADEDEDEGDGSDAAPV